MYQANLKATSEQHNIIFIKRTKNFQLAIDFCFTLKKVSIENVPIK